MSSPQAEEVCIVHRCRDRARADVSAAGGLRHDISGPWRCQGSYHAAASSLSSCLSRSSRNSGQSGRSKPSRLSSPRALVIRDGMQKRIPGRDVVSEDVLVLAEGDRVPADAALISCINLSVDESVLTGESVPVRKTSCSGDREMARREAIIRHSSIPGPLSFMVRRRCRACDRNADRDR